MWGYPTTCYTTWTPRPQLQLATYFKLQASYFQTSNLLRIDHSSEGRRPQQPEPASSRREEKQLWPADHTHCPSWPFGELSAKPACDYPYTHTTAISDHTHPGHTTPDTLHTPPAHPTREPQRTPQRSAPASSESGQRPQRNRPGSSFLIVCTADTADSQHRRTPFRRALFSIRDIVYLVDITRQKRRSLGICYQPSTKHGDIDKSSQARDHWRGSSTSRGASTPSAIVPLFFALPQFPLGTSYPVRTQYPACLCPRQVPFNWIGLHTPPADNVALRRVFLCPPPPTSTRSRDIQRRCCSARQPPSSTSSSV